MIVAIPKNLSEWSIAVRMRDGRCLRCETTVALVAHHVKPKSEYPELRLDIGNGETLCSNCHAEHHKSIKHSRPKAPRELSKQNALRKENRTLKQQLKEANLLMREESRLRSRLQAAKAEIKELLAALEEYEIAYEKLVVLDMSHLADAEPSAIRLVRKDRHKPGYMAEYMRKRRANVNNPA